jgi:hypothetical protein
MKDCPHSLTKNRLAILNKDVLHFTFYLPIPFFFRETKKIRHQAYTHLKEAVDLIYHCGRYVFCRNDARLKGYSSNHLRMKKMRWKR